MQTQKLKSHHPLWQDERQNNRYMNRDNLVGFRKMPYDQRECSDKNLGTPNKKHCLECYMMKLVDRIKRVFDKSKADIASHVLYVFKITFIKHYMLSIRLFILIGGIILSESV